MKNKFALFLILLFITLPTLAQKNPQSATEDYFDQIKNDQQKLSIFLKEMPKGGDLHNHNGGDSMAENMIQYAKGDKLCLDRKTLSVNKNNCLNENLLDQVVKNQMVLNEIINAWSMRDFKQGKETGHDHFFSTFDRYFPIVMAHTGEVLSEASERAGENNENYLELMVMPDDDASGLLGKKLGWNPNLNEMREKLLNNGLKPIISTISNQLDKDETKAQSLLLCKSKQEKPGCHVTVRYLYQVLREQPPEQVFAQLLAGFEAATADSRIVGINIVQPEDGMISMRDYKLHMKMIAFLHQLYPSVHISLHAGELAPGFVAPEGLRFHIHDAVDIGNAERIGHGVDIAHEDNYKNLLKKMAAKHILVEINLTSNADILNIKGKNHPLLLYMHYHVPVTLSTDDEGVLRTNLTEQYKQAVMTYRLSYSTIKNFARNSITYSFLPGESLWKNDEIIPVCKNDLASNQPSHNCEVFLNKSEKARKQWALEQAFSQFEKKF